MRILGDRRNASWEGRGLHWARNVRVQGEMFGFELDKTFRLIFIINFIGLRNPCGE